MARVLIVSTNCERTPFPVMPVGPAIVAAHAARAGHTVKLIDLMFSKDPAGEAASAARAFCPDVIGASLRNIDNSDLIETKFYLPAAEEILSALREAAPGVPVVLGGAATSIEPEALLGRWGPGGTVTSPSGRPLVDMLLVGDAEKRFPPLLARLEAGEPSRRSPASSCAARTARSRGAPASATWSSSTRSSRTPPRTPGRCARS